MVSFRIFGVVSLGIDVALSRKLSYRQYFCESDAVAVTDTNAHGVALVLNDAESQRVANYGRFGFCFGLIDKNRRDVSISERLQFC